MTVSFNRPNMHGNSDTPILAFCWAHLRRRFFEIHAATQSPIAGKALLRIAALYAIEAGIRGRSAERRLAARQAQSAPLVAELETWLRAQLNRLSRGTKLAEAIRYGLRHWHGLRQFLDDGRVEMDSNTVEREIRPVAIERKSWLFARSDRGGERAAAMYLLIVTAKLNDVDPCAWARMLVPSMKVIPSAIPRCCARSSRRSQTPSRARRG